MNDLIVVEKIAQRQRLKALVLDSVSSPITKRVYSPAVETCSLRRPSCRGRGPPRNFNKTSFNCDAKKLRCYQLHDLRKG